MVRITYPALGEYVPGAGQDAAKLPGMGGVYNNINLHLYHYSFNNPIRYTDPDGRAAGEEFDSPDAAAFDFAYTYNDDSIVKGIEYGSTIYSYEAEDGSTKYSYTIPNEGTRANSKGKQGVNVSKPDTGQTSVATIHTHGNLDMVDFDDQEGVNFNSIGDQEKSILPSYVVGPSGVLSVYDPNTMTRNTGKLNERPNARMLITPENNSIPKDINDRYNPTNTNIVDRNNYIKDPSVPYTNPNQIQKIINKFKFW